MSLIISPYAFPIRPLTVDRNKPINQGRVGWWLFYEGGGGPVRDIVRGNNGEISTGVWGKSSFGSGVVFDGADTLVQTPAASHLENLPALTIVVWCVPNSYGEASQAFLFSRFVSTSQRLVFQQATTGSSIAFQLDFATQDLRRYALGIHPSSDFGKVCCFAVTWDGSTSSAGVKIYKNGLESSSYGFDLDGTGGRVSDAGATTNIGNSAILTRTCDGLIGPTSIWSRALTPGEISEIYEDQWGGLWRPRTIIAFSGGTSPITGDSSWAWTGAGPLTGLGALTGDSSWAWTGSGPLTGRGSIAGDSQWFWTGAGSLAGSGALAGDSDWPRTGAGSLTGSGALDGDGEWPWTGAGPLSGLAPDGAALWSWVGAGHLRGCRALTGCPDDPFSYSTGTDPATCSDTSLTGCPDDPFGYSTSA